MTIKLKLIKTENYQGYEMNNLNKWLEEQGLLKKFSKWHFGQATHALTSFNLVQ